MTFSFLNEIIRTESDDLRLSAAYNGAMNDGGSNALLTRLQDYKQSLVVKLDLRPSEYEQLDDLQIEIPEYFKDIIKKQLLHSNSKIILL